MIIGGVFVTDPWLGFPAGVPEPAGTSWHARVHDIAPALAVDALILAWTTTTAVHLRRGSGQLS